MVGVLGMVSLYADILHVDIDSTNSVPPYADWATAASNVEAAVLMTRSGDTVLVTNGTYRLTSPITVTNSITIQSCNGADVTIIEGNGVARCFLLDSTASVVAGFTITGGAGVQCSGIRPVVTNCIFSDNSAADDGENTFGVALSVCCSPGLLHGSNGNITNEPAFIDAPRSNYHLRALSPCIDRGNNAYVYQTEDLDGTARILDGNGNGMATVDIGVYEYSAETTDSDRDGMSDAEEFYAGTNPNNPASLLAVTEIAVSGDPTSYALRWNSVSGSLYRICTSTNITSGFHGVASNVYAYQSFCIYSNTAGDDSRHFYRVTVQ